MSKHPHHVPNGENYPINISNFEKFISSIGFDGSFIMPENTEWVKNQIVILIPRKEFLDKEEVEELLSQADSSLSDFEEFIEHLKRIRDFDK